MEKILYVEGIDINGLYGSGGGPMLRYSNQISNQFIYITSTSGSETLYTLHEKIIDGKSLTYFPIFRKQNGWLHRKFIPGNFYFLFQLILKYKHIQRLQTKNIITKTYTVLWFFTLFKKGYNVCYVFPGLENLLLIGRFPKIFSRLFVPLVNWINVKAYKNLAKMFVATSSEKIEAKNTILNEQGVNNKIIRIPQAVDTTLFRPKAKNLCRSELGINHKYVFTFVGRLAKVKGVELIIDSFSLFQKEKANSLLVIIGVGEEEEQLKKHASATSANSNIIFTGKQAPPTLIDYINASDVGVFASYAEGFSNSMLEFLACGRPVISTRVGGTDELIIEGETGLTIKDRKPTTYCKLMKKIIETDLELKCTNHVFNNYTLEKQWSIIAQHWPVLELTTTN